MASPQHWSPSSSLSYHSKLCTTKLQSPPKQLIPTSPIWD
nr:MAG TPA: hypothetical protein [Caudoviricetes sp.]